MRSALFTLLFAFVASGSECLGAQAISDTTNFVFVKKSDGIALYERWYSVKPNLLAREVKAIFHVKAPAHAAIALIRNQSRGREWNKNTRTYRVVPSNESDWLGYIEYDLPWPVSNQDCVLQYRRILSPDNIRVEFQNTEHSLFPVQKNIQRIPEISGKWIFRRNNGGLLVEYYVTTTPSATLPTWITDPIIRNNLLETLRGFRAILEAPPLADVQE